LKSLLRIFEALPAGRQAWRKFKAFQTVFMRSIEKHKKHLRKRKLLFLVTRPTNILNYRARESRSSISFFGAATAEHITNTLNNSKGMSKKMNIIENTQYQP
jgi:hypothetical protein